MQEMQELQVLQVLQEMQEIRYLVFVHNHAFSGIDSNIIVLL